MRFYKSLHVQIANPSKIMEEYKHRNDALFKICNTGQEFDSARVDSTFEVSAKGSKTGLNPKTLLSTVQRAMEILRGPNGANIEKLEVWGYEADSDDKRLQPIDLIADRYLQAIELEEPRQNSDLLEGQRLSQIQKVYENCLEDFEEIFVS
jgi:hypothetical protein